jgi:MraZ protein
VSFSGSFDYSIDERGRVPLPPSFREAFADGIVLSRGSPDHCIRIWTPDEYDRMVRRITSTSSALSTTGRDLRRALVSTVHHARLDSQNRILIPAILREFAGIQSTVRVIGVWESIEIWAPEQLETDYDRIMPGLAAELDSLDDRRP